MVAYLGVRNDELQVWEDVWEDGTIPDPAGSSAVNVRLRPELLAKLNEMKASFTFVQTFVDDDVTIAMGLLAEELDEAQLRHARGIDDLGRRPLGRRAASRLRRRDRVSRQAGPTRRQRAAAAPPAADPERSPADDVREGEDPTAAGYI